MTLLHSADQKGIRERDGSFNNYPEDVKQTLIKLNKKGEIEKQDKYQFLFRNSTIVLFSYYEAAIKETVMNYFNLFENPLDLSEIKETKAKKQEFDLLSVSEKTNYLFKKFENKYAVGLKYGIERFESLLDPIGLSGNYSNDLDKNILEFSQIRNNLLHKGGIVDLQLIEQCPWLEYSLGEEIKISEQAYNKYLKSVSEHLILIVKRIGVKSNLNIKNARLKVLNN